MTRKKYVKAVRSVVPLLLVVLAIAIEIHLHSMTGEKGFLLIYPAVFAGSIIGGLLPGLLATFVASMGVWYILLPPVRTFRIPEHGDLLYLVIFTCMGILFSILSSHLRELNEHEKQTEERLRLALRSAKMGSWDWDMENDQVWRSEGHDRLFGLETPAHVSSLGAFMEYVHPDDKEQVRAAILSCLQGKDDYAVEYRVIWPDASEHWLLTQGKVFRDRAGAPLRLTGCSVDVTNRKTAEDRRVNLLDASRIDLEKEKELREKFVATLSHDLRNPLAAARTAAQVLVRYGDSPHSRDRLITRILSSIERADRMIQDFLDANRIRAGQKLPIQVEKCRLRALLGEALEELGMIHGDRFVLKEGEEIEGFWCPQGLRRVLENLANNAVKYGKPRSPVLISVSRDGAKVRISVHNEGNGLTREEQSTMFEAFRRSRAAEESGQQGWGLGLTLVRGIVDAHGGSVGVWSAPGQGVTFTIELPLDSRSQERNPLENIRRIMS